MAHRTCSFAVGLFAVAGCAADGPPPPSADLADSAATVAPAAAPAWTLPTVAADPLHRAFDVTLAPLEDGTLQSQVITDGELFTEALPSWNVPSGEAFQVEVRAQEATVDGGWSPWLRIGDWATPSRAQDTPTRFSGGKVAVDVLKLEVPYRALQLRFESPGASLSPTEVAASVVLSDTSDLVTRVEAAGREPWPLPTRTRVIPRSQRTVGEDIGGRICSPTSVSMVTAYHGANIPTRQMAEALLDPHYDIYGNWNRAVQGPATLGVPGRLVRVSSWTTVADYLKRGLPVVASIKAREGELNGAPYKKTAGHLLVVTGLGPAGAVHVHDPAARLELDVPRVYQRADMETVWFGNGGVGYVFGPRIETLAP